MNAEWEKEMKNQLIQEVSAIDFPEEMEEKILDGVHRQIRKRRKKMRKGKTYTKVILAAALVIIGTVTAIGAGKVAYYSSGHSINDEVHDFAELTAKAKGQLGENLHFPENLAEGISFSRGIVVQVEAKDEEHNVVETFPEANVYYLTEEGKSINLSVSKSANLPLSKSLEEAVEKEEVELAETYQEILISGKSDPYLFLPPDQKPSAEEQQLEAEGKLFISYGSSEIERAVFTSVSWDEGGLHYLMHTFEDVELRELIELAKNVIDSEKE